MLGKTVLQAGKLVGTIEIIVLMTVEIQIHGLRLVAGGGNVKIGAIELEMLEILNGEARLLVVGSIGGGGGRGGFIVATGWITWWSIFNLGHGTLNTTSSLFAPLGAVWWMTTITCQFLGIGKLTVIAAKWKCKWKLGRHSVVAVSLCDIEL